MARLEGFEPPTLGLEGRRQHGRACHGVPVTARSRAILPGTEPDALHGMARSFRRGNRRQTGGEPRSGPPPDVTPPKRLGSHSVKDSNLGPAD
jgi:hypothetical protein